MSGMHHALMLLLSATLCLCVDPTQKSGLHWSKPQGKVDWTEPTVKKDDWSRQDWRRDSKRLQEEIKEEEQTRQMKRLATEEREDRREFEGGGDGEAGETDSELDPELSYDEHRDRKAAASRNVFWHPPIRTPQELAKWAAVAEAQAKIERRYRELNRRLLVAVKAENMSAALAALEQGADANATDVQGTPVLCWAAHVGSRDLCHVLLEAGAHVDARDAEAGSTPLMLAAANNDAPLLEELLQYGAWAGAENREGVTAVDCAEGRGRGALKGGGEEAALLLRERAGGELREAEERRVLQAALEVAEASGDGAAVLALKHDLNGLNHASSRQALPAPGGGQLLRLDDRRGGSKREGAGQQLAVRDERASLIPAPLQRRARTEEQRIAEFAGAWGDMLGEIGAPTEALRRQRTKRDALLIRKGVGLDQNSERSLSPEVGTDVRAVVAEALRLHQEQEAARQSKAVNRGVRTSMAAETRTARAPAQESSEEMTDVVGRRSDDEQREEGTVQSNVVLDEGNEQSVGDGASRTMESGKRGNAKAKAEKVERELAEAEARGDLHLSRILRRKLAAVRAKLHPLRAK